MATIERTIEVIGLEGIDEALASFAERVADMRPTWPKVDEVIVRGVRENFSTEGRRVGGWKNLSEAYARQKAKTHPGKPIEQREGPLQESLTQRNAAGAIYESLPGSFTRGSSLPYAIAQHEGRGRLPSRELYRFIDRDADEIGNVIADDLTVYAQGLGFRTL
jgi:phage gpG-like protein